MFKVYQIFYACFLWPWLHHPLASLRYVLLVLWTTSHFLDTVVHVHLYMAVEYHKHSSEILTKFGGTKKTASCVIFSFEPRAKSAIYDCFVWFVVAMCSRCSKVLPLALAIYQDGLPPHYVQAVHLAKVSQRNLSPVAPSSINGQFNIVAELLGKFTWTGVTQTASVGEWA